MTDNCNKTAYVKLRKDTYWVLIVSIIILWVMVYFSLFVR